MSQAAHEVSELIPRPDRTPAALKAAVAIVAPGRLPELVDGQTTAMARAMEQNGLAPIRAFLAHWAAVVEIERMPERAQEYRRANYLANHAATEGEQRQAALRVAELYRQASAAVAE
ncbi:hypothetical protein ACIA8O_01080 [Kitasatospora sp. NPDC051853]|uniref:hypothetical protein n=1 Tax=Kitasatospora sp. NPDC051853 TaxID=3364058 RepID=UPI00379ABEC5